MNCYWKSFSNMSNIIVSYYFCMRIDYYLCRFSIILLVNNLTWAKNLLNCVWFFVLFRHRDAFVSTCCIVSANSLMLFYLCTPFQSTISQVTSLTLGHVHCFVGICRIDTGRKVKTLNLRVLIKYRCCYCILNERKLNIRIYFKKN